MKDGIDYREAEMRANLDNRPFEGDEFAVGFSVGWRAALEAAHARAEAKGGEEPARYWAGGGDVWAYTPDRCWWINEDGREEESVLTTSEVQEMGLVEYDTLAEARRVAGFTEKKA